MLVAERLGRVRGLPADENRDTARGRSITWRFRVQPTADIHRWIVGVNSGAADVGRSRGKVIRRYLNDERLQFTGEGPEPLFLTRSGLGFGESAWHDMHQRLRKALETRGIKGYKQHRNRNTWTRDALEAGIPETAIVQMGGWGSVDMLRRYHGKLSTSELARYPTTLSKYAQK